MSFADNLAGLPTSDHLDAVEIVYPDGRVERIANQPGSQGSVRVYAYLAGHHAALDAAAAREALDLYAEHTADAEAHPGKHPNIDRLLAIAAGSQPTCRLRCLPLSAA
jgi:hypothetical protein